MVRCNLCMKWFHWKCVGELEGDFPGAWSCNQCRDIPTVLMTLSSNMLNIQATLRSMMKKNNEMESLLLEKISENSELIKRNNKLQESHKQLECQLQQKTIEFTSLIKEDPLPKTHNDSTDKRVTDIFCGKICVQEKSDQTLLLGDSIIYDTVNHLPNECEIWSIGSAKVRDITAALGKAKTQNVKYNNVVIHVGANECDNYTLSQSIKDDFSNLVKKTKDLLSVDGSLSLSSVLPRPDKPATQENISALNDIIKEVCNENETGFVDLTFFYRDGSADTKLVKSNCLGLSSQGVDKFITDIASNTGISLLGSLPNQNIENRLHTKQSKPRSNSTSSTKCWFCAESSHDSKNCRHKQKLRCHTCYNLGHKAKFCTEC